MSAEVYGNKNFVEKSAELLGDEEEEVFLWGGQDNNMGIILAKYDG